ncbi:MAG: hypothetical protein WD939_09480 [Dehalococcoidia bacterium]
MNVHEGTVQSDGTAIHYLDWQGDGPPLVLIHATHFLPQERPDEIARLLEEFLEGQE